MISVSLSDVWVQEMSCSRFGNAWGEQKSEGHAYNVCKENVLFKVLNTITRMNLSFPLVGVHHRTNLPFLFFFQLEFPSLLKHTMYRAAMVTGIVLFT